MSSSAVRRVSCEGIQQVQNLIELCLQLYKNQKEAVETLLVEAKIEPEFTALVWKKLEEQNPEFFKAYNLRLIVNDQIREFNKLLEQQGQMMRQINQTGVAPMPTSNGSNIPSLHQNSACNAQDPTGTALNPENMQQHPIGSGLADTFSNSALSMQSPVHGTNGIGATLSMLPNQNSNKGLMSGNNEVKMNPELGYSGNSSYMFGADGNVLETRLTPGDASVSSYSSVESSAQSLNDSLLDADSSSFGILNQIPRNFSLSDLTAGFSQYSDILECYPRSPFLGTDIDNFLDSQERVEHQGDNRRLDTISESEGFSYEDCGSE